MEMSNAAWESLKNKLANLKNLAENPSTPGEAAAAAAGLQRLLFKHNLSLEDIKVADKDATGDYSRNEFDIGVTYGNVESRWKYDLLRIVASVNFCKVFHYSGTVKKAMIIGETHNVIMVTGMYEYLRDEIQRLIKRDIKIARQTPGTVPEQGFAWSYSYRTAAISQISFRLWEQRREDVAEAEKATSDKMRGSDSVSGSGSGSALVIQKDKTLSNAVAKLVGRTKASKTRGHSSFNVSASLAGRLAGKEVSLNRQVGGSKGSKTALS